MLDRPALGVAGREIKTPDAGKGDRRCAHGAGLQGDVEVRILEPVRTERGTGLANHQHLGVGRGVGQLAHAVAVAAKNAAVGPNQQGANRHFTARGCRLGFGERRQHVALTGTSCHNEGILDRLSLDIACTNLR